jgi:predicted membrane-bound spermidine synthase
VRSQRLVLHLLAFMGGAATMSVEMCASRLLAPYFGNSLPVWGALIGLLLAYLAMGYVLGGRLADRHPRASLLYQLAAWAGFLIGLIPYVARPILRYAVVGLAGYEAGAILGSLFGVLALFAVPVVLLGCISPFVMRLSVQDTASSGNVAGRIYALSTLGSLLGTFVPVFVLIPNLGTQRTIWIVSVSLLLCAIVGLWQAARRKALWYALLLAIILALQFWPIGVIKATPGMVFETESAYNYIQVLQHGEELVLKLNEGEGIQSTYRPQQLLTGYVYDYFLLAPYFRSDPSAPPVASLCLIGLAGGTIARQYSEVFDAPRIDGVEIDPAVIDVARRFFGLRQLNVRAIAQDGRYFLTHSVSLYDVIAIDAYRPPYIPFQLTTLEFFRLVHDHLSRDGVVAVNVARTENDYSLLDAIANTMQVVYPNVYVMETQGGLNSVLVATREPSPLPAILEHIAALRDPLLRDVAQRAQGRIREFNTLSRPILTDDHAPVEQIVHGIMARYILGQSICEVHP